MIVVGCVYIYIYIYIITRPDKGSGVEILDHQSYVDKMMVILGDTSKFVRLGPVDSFDHTTSIETKF